ncbi:MAG: AAA family ATPase [Chloroflexota bacterium]
MAAYQRPADSNSTEHPLRIQLLGGFQLTWQEEPVAAFSNTRLQRLLAYLILHQAMPQSRQSLAQIFWPDSSDSQARTNLRNALHLLRTHLPQTESFIQSNNKSVSWKEGSPAQVDVLVFDMLYQAGTKAVDGELAQSAYAGAIQQYKGDLLPDCHEEWILPLRDAWRQRYYQALQHLVQRLEQQQKYAEAIDIAQKMLQIDPLQENHYALLMTLQATYGDRAAALRTYHNCQTTLIDELGVEPGPATQAIYERLLNLDPDESATESFPRRVPLVGRDDVWADLQQVWKRVTQGQAEMLIVSGEAGIGKSRLTREWLTALTRQGITTALSHCYRAGGRLAFAPLQEWLRVPPIQRQFDQISPHHQQALIPLLPELGSGNSSTDVMVTGAESMQRTRLFEAMAALVTQVDGPLLLLLDDIQWCDPDTLEWIEYLFQTQSLAQNEFQKAGPMRLLLLATYRTGEIETDHPLHALKYALGRNDRLHEIELNRFDMADTAQLVKTLSGTEPSEAELARIFADTEGNPLFVEEMVRSLAQKMTDSDHAKEGGVEQSLLPTKIQSVVEGRLVRLSPTARSLADVAAVLGRVFTTGLLVAVTGDDEDTLIQGLDELWQQQIIREYGQGITMNDDAYDFVHDKLRDVVYQTLSPMRRRQLHRRAAQALEGQVPAEHSSSRMDSASSQIASHYELGGQPWPAIQWYIKASELAAQLSASQEALLHLDRALDLLTEASGAEEESAQLELSIQVGRGRLLLATKGYAAVEAEEALTRAWTLCQNIGEVHQRFKVMWGLSRFYQIQPNFDKGMEIAGQMVSLAQDAEAGGTGTGALRLEAYTALGTYHMHQGKFDSSIGLLDQSLALYNPDEHGQHAYLFGQDPRTVSLVYSAWALFCMGETEEAQVRVDEALAWSASLNHPYSQVIAQSYAAVQQQFLGNAEACLEMAESAETVAQEHGFRLWIATSGFLRGWSTCQFAKGDATQIQRALEMMQSSAELYRNTGAKTGACYFAALLAETLAQTGQIDGSSFMIQLALMQLAETHERWCEAELHRIHGSILKQTDQLKEAEAAFAKALAVAKEQGAEWWVKKVQKWA